MSHRSSTRLQHGIRKPKVYSDGKVKYGLLVVSGEPQSHEEALSFRSFLKMICGILCHLSLV
jgi:hypothetical protein